MEPTDNSIANLQLFIPKLVKKKLMLFLSAQQSKSHGSESHVIQISAVDASLATAIAFMDLETFEIFYNINYLT